MDPRTTGSPTILNPVPPAAPHDSQERATPDETNGCSHRDPSFSLDSMVPDSLLAEPAPNADSMSRQSEAATCQQPANDLVSTSGQENPRDDPVAATVRQDAISVEATSTGPSSPAREPEAQQAHQPQTQLPQRPTTLTPTADDRAALRSAPNRFASPPITLRRSRSNAAAPPQQWTLGDFLKAATKHLDAALPTPGRKSRRQPLNFTPRRGRSATAACNGAPPTAERRAQTQVLRTLGIIGVD